MAEFKVSEGQSLLDAALWLLGGVEGLFALADANGLAITDELVVGQVLVVPDGFPVSADVVSYYKQTGLVVNTANKIRPVVLPEPLPGDFLKTDFKPTDFL